jgi:hypothetical protein
MNDEAREKNLKICFKKLTHLRARSFKSTFTHIHTHTHTQRERDRDRDREREGKDEE